MSPISPSVEPICFRSPADLIESARKSQSLPPLYSRLQSPSRCFKPNDYVHLNDEVKPGLRGVKCFGSPRRSHVDDNSRAPNSHYPFPRTFQSSEQSFSLSQSPYSPSTLPSPPPSNHGYYPLNNDPRKVIKMSPTGSLGRDITSNYKYNRQSEGVLCGKLGSNKLTSMSQNSLIYSGLSGYSESAYGSINSSVRSTSALDRSSSMETLTRRERKEAMKVRMERKRGGNYGINSSSSDEEYLSLTSSQQGSETSLNRSDSKRRSRASRTERYLRRKAMELEPLRTASEKDRKSKEAVQARILELQKKKSNKGLVSNGHSNNAKNLPSSNKLLHEPYFNSKNSTKTLQNFQKFVSESVNRLHYGRRSDASTTVLPANVPSPRNKIGNNLIVPPPPPKRRDSLLSPAVTRPLSYSFEHMNHRSLSPFPNYNEKSISNDLFPYSSVKRNSTRFIDQNTNRFTRGPVNRKAFYRSVSPSTSPPTIPPSPSSDYASYVSDSSVRNTRPLTPSVDFGHVLGPNRMIKKVTSSPRDVLCPILRENNQHNLASPKSRKISQLFPNERNLKSKSTENLSPNFYGSNFQYQENTAMKPIPKPDPPARASSSIAKCHRDYLKQQINFLKTSTHSPEKLKQFILQERNRLQLSKRANLKAALMELEEIYESLDLDNEDIMDGADKREKEELLQAQMDEIDSGKSKPGRKRSPSPDILKDDLHLRRTRSIDSIHPDVLVAGLSGSYLLTSPVFGPSLSDNVLRGNSEPDVIKDDVSLRNIQMANAVKVIDPQPPFGIPLRPVSQGYRSDYLHSSPISPRKNIASFLQGMMKDDLAYRCLRKDPAAEKTERAQSLDLDELNSMFTNGHDGPVSEFYSSSQSPERNILPYPISASRKSSPHQTNKSTKKNDRRGRRFSDSYKGINSSEIEKMRKNHPPSWIERAQLSDDFWESANVTSTETLVNETSSSPQFNSVSVVRQSIVNCSRLPSAAAAPSKSDSDDSDYEFMNRKTSKICPELVKIRSLSTSPIAHVHITSPLHCNGPDFNNVPKPFYLKNVSPNKDVSTISEPHSNVGNSISVKPGTRLRKTSLKRQSSKNKSKKSSSPKTSRKNQNNHLSPPAPHATKSPVNDSVQDKSINPITTGRQETNLDLQEITG